MKIHNLTIQPTDSYKYTQIQLASIAYAHLFSNCYETNRIIYYSASKATKSKIEIDFILEKVVLKLFQ